MIRNQTLFVVACVLTLAALTAAPSHAAVQLLTSNNSSVTINDASSTGQTTWVVDGTNNLVSQWFYLSVNGAAPVAVNTLSAATIIAQSASSIHLQYTSAGLATVDLTFTLLGQAIGTLGSDLAVQAGVTNLTGATAN